LSERALLVKNTLFRGGNECEPDVFPTRAEGRTLTRSYIAFSARSPTKTQGINDPDGTLEEKPVTDRKTPNPHRRMTTTQGPRHGENEEHGGRKVVRGEERAPSRAPVREPPEDSFQGGFKKKETSNLKLGLGRGARADSEKPFPAGQTVTSLRNSDSKEACFGAEPQ